MTDKEKAIIVKVDDSLHTRVKIQSALDGKTITEVVTELLKEYVAAKNDRD